MRFVKDYMNKEIEEAHKIEIVKMKPKIIIKMSV